MLYTWNLYNIVNQLYLNFKKRRDDYPYTAGTCRSDPLWNPWLQEYLAYKMKWERFIWHLRMLLVIGRCSEFTGNLPVEYKAASSPVWAFQGKMESRSHHQPTCWFNLWLWFWRSMGSSAFVPFYPSEAFISGTMSVQRQFIQSGQILSCWQRLGNHLEGNFCIWNLTQTP